MNLPLRERKSEDRIVHWVYGFWINICFFVLPLVVTSIVLILIKTSSNHTLFQNDAALVTAQWNTLLLMTFLDVPHGLASILRVIADEEEARRNLKSYLILIAFSVLVLSLFYYHWPERYIAGGVLLGIIHQIRQQYGFVTLSNRLGTTPCEKIDPIFDKVVLHIITFGAILCWQTRQDYLNPEGLFYIGVLPKSLIPSLDIVINTCFALFIFRYLYIFFNKKYINMSKILVITSAWLYWYCGLRFIEKQSVHFPILISHTMQYLIFMGFYLNKTMPNNRVIKRIIGTVNPVLFFYIFIVFLASMVLFTGKGLNLNYRELNIWQFCFTMTAINHYIIDSIAWRNLSFNSSLQKVFKRAVHSPT